MTQLKTIKHDPAGRFVLGQVFDVAEDEVDAFIKAGIAEVVKNSHEDKKRIVEIANAVVRGDALTHPDDRAVADKFLGAGAHPDKGVPPHGVVETNDPKQKDNVQPSGSDVAAKESATAKTGGDISAPGRTGGK